MSKELNIVDDFDMDGLDNFDDIDDFEDTEDDDLENFDDFEDEDDLDNFDDLDNTSVQMDEHEINDSNLSDGALVDGVDLHDDEDALIPPREHDFIGDNGNIVVQEASDDVENGFELIYIHIDNIGVPQRIRKQSSVEDLVMSIKSTGLLKPLVVAPLATEGLYVLLDGYRRIQACARCGKTRIPCIVNNKVNTPEIPILEAMYNHNRKYSMKEQIDYINYLETQKGIMNASMIEHLLQMNSGDYTKLKDILNDNDEDIIVKLYDGTYDIATAFKKLEQRRKKESVEEKENKKAAAVYSDTEESGADQIEGSGETDSYGELTEEQINALSINATELDDGLDDTSISEMIEEDKNIDGFKPHKQETGNREHVDPALRKAVMTRDDSTCQCCKRGGEQYVDVLDFHHIVPVFLGGRDEVSNGIMLCVACHRMVHLYSTADLHIDQALLEGDYDSLDENKKMRYQNSQIFEDEKMRLKRIIKLGGKIRQGIAARGMNREQYKKEHSNNGIGRRKPGINAVQELT